MLILIWVLKNGRQNNEKFIFTSIFFCNIFSFADAEDMVLVKDGNVFLADQGFVKKDLLIDEGKIILIEDQIGDVGAGNIIYAQDKYITPGLVVFSSLGLLEIGALSETNDNSSDIYNAGFDPSKAYNPFSQAVRLNRSKESPLLFIFLVHQDISPAY